MTRTLVDAGARLVDIDDMSENTALMLAIMATNLENEHSLVEFILDEFDGDSGGSLDIRTIIGIDSTNGEGFSALGIAFDKRNPNRFRRLLYYSPEIKFIFQRLSNIGGGYYDGDDDDEGFGDEGGNGGGGGGGRSDPQLVTLREIQVVHAVYIITIYYRTNMDFLNIENIFEYL